MTDTIHVLVAEDEVLAAMAIEDYLSRKGYRVTLASDGVEAVECQRRDPAVAVVTDLRMPRMDGRHLIRTLRDGKPDLPFVVMTGFLSLDEEGDDLTAAGWMPIEVLRKPVSPQAIDDALRRLLGRLPD